MIPGASKKCLLNGKIRYKLKTARATFSLSPVPNKTELYEVQVTPRDLSGAFKNSGALYEGAALNSSNSSFGPFLLQRRPGINTVSRPNSCGPLAGNARIMWPNLDQIEKVRLFDQIDKLIRGEIPRLESVAQTPVKRAA